MVILGLSIASAGGAAERAPLPADAAYTYGAAPFVAEFEPPAPGTYVLPVIDTVADHALLDSGGNAVHLAELTRDRFTVVAFVYTTCAEAAGCPLAEAVLQRVDRRLADDPTLAAQVRLLTVSFDPDRDTPARMATVRAFYAPKSDWVFLTTANEGALQPLLDDFGQPVSKLTYEDGEWTGLYRHVLKVFLLDPRGQIRNIYSTGMISPELVITDLRTLALETPPR